MRLVAARLDAMEPNNGLVTNGVRVLLTSMPTGRQRWYWWIVSLVTAFQGDAERERYVVRVLAADTSAPLAARSFDRASTARRVRERFVGLLERSEIDHEDGDRIQGLLDSVRTD